MARNLQDERIGGKERKHFYTYISNRYMKKLELNIHGPLEHSVSLIV